MTCRILAAVAAAASIGLMTSIATATDVRSYDLDLRLEPAEERLHCSVVVEVGLATGQGSVLLLLNRGLSVDSLSANRPLEGFEIRREERAVLRYAAEASPLEVRLASPATEPGTLRLILTYSGALEPGPWGVNMITPEWVEIGLYSGWFPLDPQMGRFDATAGVTLPDSWTMVGTGTPVRQGNRWMSSSGDIGDIVVLAAPSLVTRRAGDSVRIHGPDRSPERLQAAAAAASSILGHLVSLLGPAPGDRLDIVFSPRERGGGYVRPGLAVLQDDGGDFASPGWIRYLAHEISHLWWHHAPTITWEDWVNESFAEVTALIMVRELKGEEAFQHRVERYREEAADAPPIRDLDRDDEAAYAALYRKGPLLLLDVERRVGGDTFARFLREVASRRAASTDEVLAILERVASPAVAGELDASLGR